MYADADGKASGAGREAADQREQTGGVNASHGALIGLVFTPARLFTQRGCAAPPDAVEVIGERAGHAGFASQCV